MNTIKQVLCGFLGASLAFFGCGLWYHSENFISAGVLIALFTGVARVIAHGIELDLNG